MCAPPAAHPCTARERTREPTAWNVPASPPNAGRAARRWSCNKAMPTYRKPTMGKHLFQEIDGSAFQGQGPVPPRSARLPHLVGLAVDPHAVLDALDVTAVGI